MINSLYHRFLWQMRPWCTRTASPCVCSRRKYSRRCPSRAWLASSTSVPACTSRICRGSPAPVCPRQTRPAGPESTRAWKLELRKKWVKNLQQAKSRENSQSRRSTLWYELSGISSFNVPESLYQPTLLLEKLASSLESLDVERWCFLRRKKLRRAVVEPRRASFVSRSPKLRRNSSSSSTLVEFRIRNVYASFELNLGGGGGKGWYKCALFQFSAFIQFAAIV